MDSIKDSLSFWATILGTAVGIFGLAENLQWLAILGFLVLAASFAALLYALKERRRLKLAAITIEGRRIDSLNVANLARRLNRTLVIQEADQVATIKGEDLAFVWRYAGYCGAAHESAVEFSVDMDHHVPFEYLDCYAYDLRNDPQRTHRIRPVLLGSDGLSKKIAVPLLRPLSAMEPFSVTLICRLPSCMKSGVDYYTSTVSVAQPSLQVSSVRLVFIRDLPEWLRVYECDATGAVRLIRDLRPSLASSRRVEYLDLCDGVPAQSARIYLFRRRAISHNAWPRRTHHTPVVSA